MKNMRRNRKRRFTLVELLVSMGVLLVILGFVLQFFVNSQRIWTSMTQRNRIYADSRVAMDIMTTMLQNTFYSDGGIPFRVDAGTGKSKIYFATRTMQNLPGNALKYVSFQRDDNDLKISVFTDRESDFGNFFPPYGVDTITDLAAATSSVVTKLDSNLSNADYGSILIPRVVAFDVIPYEQNITSGDAGINSVGSTDEPPYMVELRLTVLSPNDYKIWNTMTDSDPGSSQGLISDGDNDRVKFRKNNAYVFSRTVFLGEQARMSIKD